MLKQLLYSDLARQAALEDRPGARPTVVRFVRRLLHPRFLPIVLFGLEVSPRCEIGPGIFFPHPSGTVIGAWRIGSNVTIFQGVTLGARELDMRFDRSLRPDIGDNVLLGAGCKILGGIHVGDGVTVGANSVVLDSIENNSTVVGVPARRVSERRDQSKGVGIAAST
jgi:serine O-acetyltransferase